MTNKDVLQLYEGLNELAANENIKLTVQASYYLAYNKNILEPFYKAAIDTRNTLLDKYGVKSNNGWTVPKEQLDAFSEAWDQCLSIEVPLSLRGIKLNDISGQVNLDLMRKILPFIEE